MRRHNSNDKQSTMITMHIAHRWKKMVFAVMKGSILGSILFNILHSNLYIGVGNADFVSYADDNSIYDTDDFTSSFFRGKNVQNVFL